MTKSVLEWVSEKNDPKAERFTQREMGMVDTMLSLNSRVSEANKHLKEAWVKQKDLEIDNARLRA